MNTNAPPSGSVEPSASDLSLWAKLYNCAQSGDNALRFDQGPKLIAAHVAAATATLCARVAELEAQVAKSERKQGEYLDGLACASAKNLKHQATIADLTSRLAKAEQQLAEANKELKRVTDANWDNYADANSYRDKWKAAESALASAEAQLADYKFVLGNRRDHKFVDASPDAELPVRILQAYLEEGHTVSMPEEIGKLINKWQAERNVILREAIDRLAQPSPSPTSNGGRG
jgi:chromosome segregation ATPase